MTNFEYWKEKILEIAKTGSDIAVAGGKPTMCEDTQCSECDFQDIWECGAKTMLIEWLCAEHEEKPMLTKKERMFCEIMETGWIARDRNGDLRYLAVKPEKEEGPKCINWLDIHFKFIKWEDEKPWSMEELLKLDVKREVGESGSKD